MSVVACVMCLLSVSIVAKVTAGPLAPKDVSNVPNVKREGGCCISSTSRMLHFAWSCVFILLPRKLLVARRYFLVSTLCFLVC